MNTQVDIRELRQARGWSQEHLARMLHVDRSTISRMENGRTKPSGPVSALLRGLVEQNEAAA